MAFFNRLKPEVFLSDYEGSGASECQQAYTLDLLECRTLPDRAQDSSLIDNS
jgi:hypothetical protein